MLIYFLQVPIGIIAGWSVEVGIVLIALQFASFFLAMALKKKLPLWYYLGFLSFVTGWIILYSSPGTHLRGAQSDYYLSLAQIVHLGPIGICRRILLTFDMEWKRYYGEVFLLVTLFLGVTSVFYKPNAKKIILNALAVMLFAFSIVRLPKIMFMLEVILVISLNMYFLRKENKRVFVLYAAFLAVFAVEFLFVLSTIQMTLPRRAKLHLTLLQAVLLSLSMTFCFETFATQKKVQAAACAALLLGTILYSCFVGTECFTMYKKWKAMEQTVMEQKARGKTYVVVPKETFISTYWGYGGFPPTSSEESVDWIEALHAWYYGVENYIIE